MISTHGYIKTYVGEEHHQADSKGYAYEHRLVAERIIGRDLKSFEIVHHKDGNKQNNEPSNLEIVVGNAAHFLKHRKRADLRLPDEPNTIVSCKCGCGETLSKYDVSGRPRKYISGHNPPNSPTRSAILKALNNSQLSVSEIVEETRIGRRAINVCLIKLHKAGLIVRVKTGTYGLPGTPIRINETIECACGCGEKFLKYDQPWRTRKYKSGHNWRAKCSQKK